MKGRFALDNIYQLPRYWRPATFCVAIAQDEFDFSFNGFGTILERKPQFLKEFLKATYQLTFI